MSFATGTPFIRAVVINAASLDFVSSELCLSFMLISLPIGHCSCLTLDENCGVHPRRASYSFRLAEFRYFIPQILIFLLKRTHALFRGAQCILYFLLGEARRDVLRAVPIERFYANHEYSLDGRLVIRISNLRDPLFRFFSLD